METEVGEDGVEENIVYLWRHQGAWRQQALMGVNWTELMEEVGEDDQDDSSQQTLMELNWNNWTELT